MIRLNWVEEQIMAMETINAGFRNGVLKAQDHKVEDQNPSSEFCQEILDMWKTVDCSCGCANVWSNCKNLKTVLQDLVFRIYL